MRRFEQAPAMRPEYLAAQAARFDVAVFRRSFAAFAEAAMTAFFAGTSPETAWIQEVKN